MGSNSAPTGDHVSDPSGTVKEGDPVTFSAAGPPIQTGTISPSVGLWRREYWNWIDHKPTYAQSKRSFVAKLAVGDGTIRASISKTITVVDSSVESRMQRLLPARITIARERNHPLVKYGDCLGVRRR